MGLIDDVKSDMTLAATRKKSAAKWSVELDKIPGVIYIFGPAQKLTIITTATDLNGEDFVARHADARRIARVPDMEAALIAADELAAAMLVYSEPCEATETTSCGFEGNMCCMTARNALAVWRKATGAGQ